MIKKLKSLWRTTQFMRGHLKSISCVYNITNENKAIFLRLSDPQLLFLQNMFEGNPPYPSEDIRTCHAVICKQRQKINLPLTAEETTAAALSP